MKEKNKEDFYRLLTKFYGFCIWFLSALGITYHLLNSSLSIPYFLICSAGFMAGKYIQRTAYQD